MTPNQMMAAMKSLGAHRCCLDFSDWTGKWYMSFSIDVSDGCIRKGVTEHRENPTEAVIAMWIRVTTIGANEHLVVYRGNDKPDWRGRWNGYMWEERPAQVKSA